MNQDFIFNGIKVDLRHKEKLLVQDLLSAYPASVSREEIRVSVWDGRFVSDYTINQTINSIRRKLNDHDRSIIKTVPKFGYGIGNDYVKSFSWGHEVREKVEELEEVSVSVDRMNESIELYTVDTKKLSFPPHQKMSKMILIVIFCFLFGVCISEIFYRLTLPQNISFSEQVLHIEHDKILFSDQERMISCDIGRLINSAGEVTYSNDVRCHDA